MKRLVKILQWNSVRPALAVALFATIAGYFSAALYAQEPQEAAPPPAAGQALTPEQLNDLVAPIALYPDPLLSQVLVASTYPLQLVQAYQWLQKNPGLTGAALTQAAQGQNWDTSIRALVVFPDVMARLNEDITWTTNLGNAFLSQPPDVMDAVQRMRAEAEQAGKLAPTPQENVATEPVDGQDYIEIQPANPDTIYVPDYDPASIWGPALWYPYPQWAGPQATVAVGGLGYGFGGGIYIGAFFGDGWTGWSGWGWSPAWGTHTIIVNNGFIHRSNLTPVGVTDVHGTTVWRHNPAFRASIPSSARPNEQRPVSVRQDRPYAPETRPANQASGDRFVNRTPPPNQAAPRPQIERGSPSFNPGRAGGGSGAVHAAPQTRGGSADRGGRH